MADDASPPLGRRVAFTATIAAVAVATAIAIVLTRPAVYRAEASIVLPLGQAPGAAPQLAVGGGGLLSRGATPLDFVVGLLQSRRALERLASTGRMPVRRVEQVYKVTPMPSSNQIQVRVEVEDPRDAQRMVEEALEELEAINREVGVGLAESQAERLKEAAEAKEGELLALERRLVEYQGALKSPVNPGIPYVAVEAYRSLFEAKRSLTEAEAALEARRKAVGSSLETEYAIPESVGATALWRQRLDEAELKFRKAQAEFTPQSTRYREAKDEFDQTVAQFRESVRKSALAVREGVDPETAQIVARRAVAREMVRQAERLARVAPVESAEVQRQLRQIDIANRVYGQVRLRYEEAVLAAMVGETRWSLLVPPFVLEEPVNKGLFAPAVIGLISGGFMGWLIGGIRPRPRRA